VEKELDILIERRSRQADQEEEHDLWRESVRRHNERVREENRAAWAAFHEGQAESHRRTLEGLIARHEMQAARLCEKGA